MKALLFCILFLGAIVDLNAQAPRLDTIAFFKESAGVWKGTGTSIVGPEKKRLEVRDEWKSEFAKDGTIFVQVGTVKLSNGTGFQYRWVYQVDSKTQKLIALYTDSKNIRDAFLVQLSDDQRSLSIAPIDSTGAPAKGGLFTNLYFKEGRLGYGAEVRDPEGKPFIQTTLSAVKEPQKTTAAP